MKRLEGIHINCNGMHPIKMDSFVGWERIAVEERVRNFVRSTNETRDVRTLVLQMGSPGASASTFHMPLLQYKPYSNRIQSDFGRGTLVSHE